MTESRSGLPSLMIRLTGPHWPELRAALAWSLFASLVQAGSYVLLLPILSTLGSTPFDADRLAVLLSVFAFLVVVEGFARRKELGFSYDSFAFVIENLRLRLGRRLRLMPYESLQRKASGDLAAVVGSNVSDAVMAIGAVATVFCQFVSVPVVLVFVIAAVDWRLAVVLLVTVPFAIPFVRRLRSVAGAGYAESTKADGVAASRVVEYVQGLAVFKASGQTGAAANRLRAAFAQQDKAMSHTQRGITMPSILASSMIQLGIVGMVAMGSALVLDANLEPLALIAVVAAAVRFAEPLVTATVMTLAFEYAQAGSNRIDEILRTPELPGPSVPARPSGATVEFDGVTFCYEGSERPVVQGVSCLVPERCLTALVGPSGSGKSTMARLVTRFADPREGVVRLGGVDVRDIEQSELMRNISVVFQDVYLFDDTIEANIRMGRQDATESELLAAARAAHCDDFVRALPDGYQTMVGEVGHRLSGGERQRISIARAILKNAPIVLLDEPTSALDPESETAVQTAINGLVAHKTVLVIAHRLSTVMAADQILVLDDGRIVERGKHDDLLASDGRYAAMWRAQSRSEGWRLTR